MNEQRVARELLETARLFVAVAPEVWGVETMGRVISFWVNLTPGLKRSDLNRLGRRMIPVVEKVLVGEGFPRPKSGDFDVMVSLQKNLASSDVVIDADYYREARLDDFLMRAVVRRNVEKAINLTKRASDVGGYDMDKQEIAREFVLLGGDMNGPAIVREEFAMNDRKVKKELLSAARELADVVRDRVAWNMNAADISLDAARAYAEDQFAKSGQELDVVLPDFDRNFMLLKRKLGKALNVPRMAMPVIEPEDMDLFNKRLSEGSIDIFAPYARGKLYAPRSLSRSEGEEWVTLGFADDKPNDDKLRGTVGSTPVKNLYPTQSQIWFDKLIQNILKYGPVSSGSPVLTKTIIVSRDGYILDGHHRFGQAILCDPSLSIRSLTVPLDIDMLLKVGKTYGEAIGNKPKASVSKERVMKRNEAVRELVRAAREIVGDEWPSKVEKGGLRGAMGLNEDEPLEDQASPGDVANFFEGADEEGRGMVMFAVNSNRDVPFWQKVGDMIED
jgi:hypothetical protein